MVGSIEKHKSHLVAQEFSQKKGINYLENFSPTTKMDTIHIILSPSVHWEVHQIDVKFTFLNGDLCEETYMWKPLGFVDTNTYKLVCKLKKSPYGLKQAPRAWHKKIDHFFLASGFNCCQ